MAAPSTHLLDARTRQMRAQHAARVQQVREQERANSMAQCQLFRATMTQLELGCVLDKQQERDQERQVELQSAQVDLGLALSRVGEAFEAAAHEQQVQQQMKAAKQAAQQAFNQRQQQRFIHAVKQVQHTQEKRQHRVRNYKARREQLLEAARDQAQNFAQQQAASTQQAAAVKAAQAAAQHEQRQNRPLHIDFKNTRMHEQIAQPVQPPLVQYVPAVPDPVKQAQDESERGWESEQAKATAAAEAQARAQERYKAAQARVRSERYKSQVEAELAKVEAERNKQRQAELTLHRLRLHDKKAQEEVTRVFEQNFLAGASTDSPMAGMPASSAVGTTAAEQGAWMARPAPGALQLRPPFSDITQPWPAALQASGALTQQLQQPVFQDMPPAPVITAAATARMAQLLPAAPAADAPRWSSSRAGLGRAAASGQQIDTEFTFPTPTSLPPLPELPAFMRAPQQTTQAAAQTAQATQAVQAAQPAWGTQATPSTQAAQAAQQTAPAVHQAAVLPNRQEAGNGSAHVAGGAATGRDAAVQAADQQGGIVVDKAATAGDTQGVPARVQPAADAAAGDQKAVPARALAAATAQESVEQTPPQTTAAQQQLQPSVPTQAVPQPGLASETGRAQPQGGAAAAAATAVSQKQSAVEARHEAQPVRSIAAAHQALPVVESSVSEDGDVSDVSFSDDDDAVSDVFEEQLDAELAHMRRQLGLAPAPAAQQARGADSLSGQPTQHPLRHEAAKASTTPAAAQLIASSSALTTGATLPISAAGSAGAAMRPSHSPMTSITQSPVATTPSELRDDQPSPSAASWLQDLDLSPSLMSGLTDILLGGSPHSPAGQARVGPVSLASLTTNALPLNLDASLAAPGGADNDAASVSSISSLSLSSIQDMVLRGILPANVAAALLPPGSLSTTITTTSTTIPAAAALTRNLASSVAAQGLTPMSGTTFSSTTVPLSSLPAAATVPSASVATAPSVTLSSTTTAPSFALASLSTSVPASIPTTTMSDTLTQMLGATTRTAGTSLSSLPTLPTQATAAVSTSMVTSSISTSMTPSITTGNPSNVAVYGSTQGVPSSQLGSAASSAGLVTLAQLSAAATKSSNTTHGSMSAAPAAGMVGAITSGRSSDSMHTFTVGSGTLPGQGVTVEMSSSSSGLGTLPLTSVPTYSGGSGASSSSTPLSFLAAPGPGLGAMPAAGTSRQLKSAQQPHNTAQGQSVAQGQAMPGEQQHAPAARDLLQLPDLDDLSIDEILALQLPELPVLPNQPHAGMYAAAARPSAGSSGLPRMGNINAFEPAHPGGGSMPMQGAGQQQTGIGGVSMQGVGQQETGGFSMQFSLSSDSGISDDSVEALDGQASFSHVLETIEEEMGEGEEEAAQQLEQLLRPHPQVMTQGFLASSGSTASRPQQVPMQASVSQAASRPQSMQIAPAGQTTGQLSSADMKQLLGQQRPAIQQQPMQQQQQQHAVHLQQLLSSAEAVAGERNPAVGHETSASEAAVTSPLTGVPGNQSQGSPTPSLPDSDNFSDIMNKLIQEINRGLTHVGLAGPEGASQTPPHTQQPAAAQTMQVPWHTTTLPSTNVWVSSLPTVSQQSGHAAVRGPHPGSLSSPHSENGSRNVNVTVTSFPTHPGP